jgi:hypothetical protein
VMAFFDACTRIERAYGAPRSALDWVTKLRQARGYIPLRELESQGAFSPSAVQVASVVLDHFSGPASTADLKTLERALTPTSDYPDLIRLFCTVAWVNSPVAKEEPSEIERERPRWDRITSNLLANHRIDDVYAAILAVKGVQALATLTGNLYEALSKTTELPSGFSGEQAKEEVFKARLIVDDPSLEALFLEAEAHSYLQGKIGFLLDFSTSSEGAFDRDAFTRYSERAGAVLDTRVRASTEHLLERALLSIDDYLIGRGSSKFSFCQSDAGTYRDRSENWLRVIGRPGFQKLLDRIEGEVNAALRKLIDGAVCTDWRRYIVANPQLIDYCGERLIHREDSGDVYLLSRKRLSGYHAELRSYSLFHALQRSKGALPGMSYRYEETYDDKQPALVLQVDAQELRVSYEAGAWRCNGPTGQAAVPEGLVRFMGEHGFTDASS